MKNSLLTACFFLLALTTFAQKVEINNNGFFLKGKKVTKASTMVDIETIMGKPDKIFPLANIIWTYDNLGIYIYFAPGDSTLKHISFDLIKHDLKFSPANPFKGSFVIHNNLVGKRSSLSKLKKIKAVRFEENPVYLDPAYTSYVKIYFEFDAAKASLLYAGVSLNFKNDVEN